MNVRKAKMSDLSAVKDMYNEVVEDMLKKGISIWDEVFPCDFLEQDIKTNSLYIMENACGDIVWSFALYKTNNASLSITWIEDKPAMYLSRLAVNVKYLHQGFALHAIDEARKQTKNNLCEYLRLFVVDSNFPAIKLYQKYGFVRGKGSYIEVVDETLSLLEYGYEIAVN